MVTLEEMTTLIDKQLYYADEVFKYIPSSQTREHIVATALIFGLYDILYDINCLVKNKRLLSTPALTRTFLETYIDLELVIKDSKYISALIASSYKEQKKLLKFQKGLAVNGTKEQEIENNINALELEYQSLGKHGISELKIWEKFRAAGYEDIYKSVYNDLCSQAHNSIFQIGVRHILLKNDKVTLQYMQDYDFGDYAKYFYLLVEYFATAVIKINIELDLKQD